MARFTLAGAACALLLGSAALPAYADPYGNTQAGTAQYADVEFGFDIGVDRAHQEFEESTADLTTVSFVPRLMFGNWALSLDLPWQRAEGEYFVNSSFPPTLAYACQYQASRLLKYPALLTRLLGNPDGTAAQLYNYCQTQGSTSVQDSVSGLSDATLFVRYGLPLDADGIWLLSVGGGYKFDNGDADKNLGSGTRNTLLEATIGASYGWFIGSATAGYAWIDATDSAYVESNYSYALLDAGIRPVQWLTLGCSWSSDESYYAGGETIEKTTAYVRVKPLDSVGIKVYVSDYGNTFGYPDPEYGASIYYSY